MQVPAFDITRQNKLLETIFTEAFHRVLTHGHFILGGEVKEFEQKMAQYLNAKHVIAVANGSDALVLSLLALGIGPGDEVIVPAFTFFATAGAVSRVGAKPVFVDVVAVDYNIDLQQVQHRVTTRTKAIIPVHLFGMPVKMNELTKIAAENNLAIIEDAAQALGSTYRKKPVGTFGELGCFSFFPTKNLGCFGDGGMVVTDLDELAEKLRMLRVHGSCKKYYHELLGFNSRLDTLQAAFLHIKMSFLDQWLETRRQMAEVYQSRLQDIPEIELPLLDEGHSYNQFTIKTTDRDGLKNFLAKKGIGTTVYYPLALHLQPVFTHLEYKEGEFPVSETLTKKVLSLPIFPEMTSAEQNYVIEIVRSFYRKGSQ